jgi:hypothetical protein
MAQAHSDLVKVTASIARRTNMLDPEEMGAHGSDVYAAANKADDQCMEWAAKLVIVREQISAALAAYDAAKVCEGSDVAQAVPHVANAEFCPYCNPCRNGERIAKAERLNVDYDCVLRHFCSSLGAGGYNSAGLIEPKVAEQKIEWGIDHLIKSFGPAHPVAQAEWQPIETLQPNVTVALLCANRWMADDVHGQRKDIGYLTHDGWFSTIGEMRAMTRETYSHWYPLPQPPAPTTTSKEGT